MSVYVPFCNLIRESVDSLEELKKSYVFTFTFFVVTVEIVQIS